MQNKAGPEYRPQNGFFALQPAGQRASRDKNPKPSPSCHQLEFAEQRQWVDKMPRH
jgi:hypothetical protein